MAYADVINPVKISTSVVLSSDLDNYLRRMCIVSAGDSNLEIGDSVEVKASTYANYVESTDSEVYKKLKGFFAFAEGKSVVLHEVGAFNVSSNTIKDQVSTLSNRLISGTLRAYMTLVPDDWYYPSQGYVVSDDTKTALYLGYTSVSVPQNGSISIPFMTNADTITTAYGVEADSQVYSVNVNTDENVININVIGETSQTKTLTISAIVDGGEEVSTNISVQVLAEGETAVTSGEFKSNYVLGRDTSFASLLQDYNGIEDTTYFMVKANNEDPTTSDGFTLYKDMKSIFVVYDNFKSTMSYPLSSVILGIIASSKYDLGSSQKATPLNNKSISGVSFQELGNTLADSLTQAPMNYCGDFAGTTVIFNGRYCDGQSWEYYYQYNVVMFKIEEALKTLLLNSANNTNFILTYNQNGIDTLVASIKSVLNTWKEYGAVTEFAASIDAQGELQDEGELYAIDFYTYINENEDNYAAGIYGGISFYLMIGRFIKEVNLSITLN